MYINVEGDFKENTINNIEGSLYQLKEREKKVSDILYDSLITVQSRKHFLDGEDQKNQKLTDQLRNKGLYASDESPQGRSGSGQKNGYKSGELDIAIRGINNNGNAKSIIEAFELAYCGPKNKVVKNHIDKLINSYDTAGNPENYIVVYSMAEKFSNLWGNYQKFVEKKIFNDSKIRTLDDDYFGYSDIKVGINIYERSGEKRKLFHFFVNMYVG